MFCSRSLMIFWSDWQKCVYSKMAEKRIYLIFVDSDLNLCKASQVRTFSPRARASLHGSL